ncbi:unnamed protein product [Hymenolepis diminuta]|uniref:PRELI/MSF1 domain-containing protein n=1 Tax=Hymenolepis diminuta TaxID=6216 RepID=A0A0R3SK61_HYMDI|nr:unnamed protein product [Hymenolepis diminuta]VUZ52799.1 unnamed protein product [Hymenolepis diminuta]
MVGAPYVWKGEFVIKKPWNDVMRAAQVKYPNPFNPNVLSIDIISRKVDSETGVLYTTKLINSSWPMFSNAGELRAIERTEVDPANQRMLLESNNIDMRSVLKAHERLEYEVHPDNSEWTLIRHQISVDAFSFIAYAALSASQKAAKSGREALNWVIENRVDNFMSRVSDRIGEAPSITAPITSSLAPVSNPKLHPSFPVGLLSRLRSFSLPSLHPLVTIAKAKVLPIRSSCLTQQTNSISNLPAVFDRAITSFDSFHPVDALGEIKDRVATDVSALSERLRQRCQRVIDRFSKIDEYVLIM